MPPKIQLPLASLILFLLTTAASAGEWNGYEKQEFTFEGRPAYLVLPKQPAPGNPWIWRAHFPGVAIKDDIALLAKGFHVVYLDTNQMFGSPDAVAIWDRFHAHVTEKYSLSKKPVLKGLSRGGLYIFNFAAAHPDKVAAIYGDAPVCDFKSWPGGKTTGKRSPGDWQLLLKSYGLKDEAEALKYDKNPVDNLAPIAQASIPVLIVAGDSDDVVPYAENGAIIAQRYEKLGGKCTVILKKGVGHHPHGLEENPQPIVDFILAAVAGADKAADDFPREKFDETGFVPLFDGKTLNGWKVSAETGHSRTSGNKSGGKWFVEDGAITGTQDVPGNGGIILTEKQYGDFEIALEMRNDFVPDSGLFLRSNTKGQAYQYLVDYHADGNLAGLYGEGLNPGFHIRNFSFTDDVKVIKPVEAPTPLPIKPEDWPKFWQHGKWNELRARITGNPPHITTWINGVKFMEWQDDQKRAPDAGHIALQVHGGGDLTKHFVRYRNIRVKEIK